MKDTSNYLEWRRMQKLGLLPPKEPKTRKPIKPVSAKRQEQNKEYGEKARPMWKGKMCAIKSPVCTKEAQGIHHLKGKDSASLLLDERFWMPACNRCNVYVEEKPQWAYDNGFKLKRNNKTIEQ